MPKNTLSLNDELIELRKRIREQDKEIRRLKEVNKFLKEGSAFFTDRCRKSTKNIWLKHLIFSFIRIPLN